MQALLGRLRHTSNSPRQAREAEKKRREEEERRKKEEEERKRQAKELEVLRRNFPRVEFHAMDLDDRPIGEGKYAVVKLGTWYPDRQRHDIGADSMASGSIAAALSGHSATGSTESEGNDISLDQEEDSGVRVAVKQFKNLRDLGRTAEFIHELQGLLSLSDHPNLVRLIGACWEPQMMVVYECLDLGNLRVVIESAPPKWGKRRRTSGSGAGDGLESAEKSDSGAAGGGTVGS